MSEKLTPVIDIDHARQKDTTPRPNSVQEPATPIGEQMIRLIESSHTQSPFEPGFELLPAQTRPLEKADDKDSVAQFGYYSQRRDAKNGASPEIHREDPSAARKRRTSATKILRSLDIYPPSNEPA